MSANESQTHISAAHVELDCAHGDRLRIEAVLVGANSTPSQRSFLSVSAAYMLGAAGDPADAPADPSRGFATGYRGLVGDEIAALVGVQLQDLLAASGATTAGRTCDVPPDPDTPPP